MRTIHTTLALGLLATAPLTLGAALEPAPEPAVETPPMLYYWRVSLRPENADAASSILRRMLAYERADPESPEPRAMTNSLHQNNTAHWFMSYSDLDMHRHWERIRDEDEGWNGIVSGLNEAFQLESDLEALLFHVAGPIEEDRSKTLRHIRVTHSREFLAPTARSFAARVVEYLETNYEGLDARAYSSDLDDPGAIFWLFDYESPSTWEAIRHQMLADQEYAGLMRSGVDLFLDQVRNDVVLNY